MKKAKAALILWFVTMSLSFAQGISINITGNAADTSAMLDVSSTEKGILVPRMTEAQRTAIALPAVGLMVYQTDSPSGFYYYTGSEWTQVAPTKQEAWSSPIFENSWTNYGANGYNNAGYFRDNNGIVHLRGLVKDGTNQSVIFTLPTGYRPAGREMHICLTNGGVVRVDVESDGKVQTIENHSSWLNIDGITFRANGY